MKRDNEATSDLLLLVGIDAAPPVVAAWSDEQVEAAEKWAGSTHLRASDNPIRVPKRPAFLPEPWRDGIETPVKGLAERKP